MSDFPLPPSRHGTTMATVKVGQHPKQQTFVIHRDLLCNASEYFARALSGVFKEALTQELILVDDSVEAFQVLYTWLYSGQLRRSTFFGDYYSSDDFMWLQTYQFATMRLVTKLQEEAYHQLTATFNKYTFDPPSTAFIERLYQSPDNLDQCGQLREYVVNHSSWGIAKTTYCNWTKWNTSLEASTTFAAAVALQMTKLLSTDPTHEASHPADDETLSKYKAAWTKDEKGTNDDKKTSTGPLKRKREYTASKGARNRLASMMTPASSTLRPNAILDLVETLPVYSRSILEELSP